MEQPTPSELVTGLQDLLLKRLGVETSPQPPEQDRKHRSQQELRLRHGNRTLEMTIRHIKVSSRFLVESAIVHAAARRAAATGDDASRALCLALDTVAAELPSGVLTLLQGAHLPVVDFILLGRRGRSWVHLPTLGIAGQWIEPTATDALPPKQEAPARNVFTPATLWIFKAIVYSGVKHPEKLWGGPFKTWTSATDLANARSLSVPTVTRALKAMANKGWIQWDRGQPIRCIQPELAITAWIDYGRVTNRRGALTSVTPVFDAPASLKPGNALDWLARQSAVNTPSGQRWAINSWFAADHHRLRSVTDLSTKKVSIVTEGSVRDLVDRWKLVATDPRDALFTIESTTDSLLLDAAPEIVGQVGTPTGSLPAPSHLRWVDPIQSAIDIARDPNQGVAQANTIAFRFGHDLVQR